MKNEGACLKCTERVVGCHGKCPKYQAYRKELDNLKQKMLEYKIYDRRRYVK